MKRFALLASALLMCLAYGCNEVPEPEVKAPTILLEKGVEGVSSVSFKATTTDATKAAYVVVKDGENLPALADILASGTEMTLDENGAAEVTAEGLEANTKYQVVAAAANGAVNAGSNTLYMTTLKVDDVAVSVEVVHVDHESMSFRVNASGASRVAYLVLYASKNTPEASYVLLNGEDVDLSSREAVLVENLECNKEYQLVVVAEGVGATAMAEPVLFTTDDDPANVLTHHYTRAKGTKYGSNYYMMFSYEDPNEAENFGYNEKTLSLDMYGDPNKDYLPAGTYPVMDPKDAAEGDNYVSSLRYTNYGYNDQIRILSGVVVVEIDPDTKAYSFDVDVILADGRHMKATYNGDVDNMPVVDIVSVNTTFTEASAATADKGEKWNVVLKDAEGNEAHLDVYNAHKAAYMVANTYTISTSTETEEGKTPNTDLEPGEFDAATSYFVLATGETMPFATGSFHVTIDWEKQTYDLALYATLGKNYVVEAKYQGAVDGVSLEESDEIIDVVLNTAAARGYEGNSNWYLTFTQTEGDVQNYYLALDIYCPPTPYLSSGTYKLGVGTGEGYIATDASKLNVKGEGEYSFKEATLNVTTNAAEKTFLFNISLKIEDGRTFVMSYTGAVEGMEIVSSDDSLGDINWTTFSAKRWYSDNWQLLATDADGKYTIEFDLRIGDSGADHILPGTYTFDTSKSQYVDKNYTKLNNDAKVFSELTLVLEYDSATKNYAVSFEAKHVDGRTFSGTYNGPIAGSPAQ